MNALHPEGVLEVVLRKVIVMSEQISATMPLSWVVQNADGRGGVARAANSGLSDCKRDCS